VRARFDLVAFDPRGVGRSAPVRCGTTPELDAYFALDPTPDDPAEVRAYEEGNALLVAGCERRAGDALAHVSTVDAAEDMERLRAALGDDRLTYLGYSYGTSLGAAYLDRFPERTRAMVLDGGIDPTLTWDRLLAGQSSGFDRALEAFLADCEKERCAFRRQVSGPLAAAYDRLAAEVERTPLRGTGGRTVGPGEFSLGVGAGLYSRDSGWPAIAAALAAADRGDGRPLLALSDSYLQRGPDGYANISEANLAVNCTDRPWPRETGALPRARGPGARAGAPVRSGDRALGACLRRVARAPRRGAAPGGGRGCAAGRRHRHHRRSGDAVRLVRRAGRPARERRPRHLPRRGPHGLPRGRPRVPAGARGPLPRRRHVPGRAHVLRCPAVGRVNR